MNPLASPPARPAGPGSGLVLLLALASASEQTGLRRRLLDEVQKYPGLHLRELARALGIPPSHAQYHLRVLEKTGLVAVERQEGYLRHYPTKATPVGNLPHLGAHERGMLRLLRQPAILRILVVLLLDGPLALAELGRRCGVTPATSWHHVQRLSREGIVERSPAPEPLQWRVRDPELVRRLLIEYEPPPAYVEGFLEAWQRLTL